MPTKLLTAEEVRKEIKDQVGEEFCIEQAMHRVNFVPEKKVTVGENANLYPTPQALQQIATKMKVPAQVISKASTGLRLSIAQEFPISPELGKFVIEKTGNILVDILPKDAVYLPVLDLYDRLMNRIKGVENVEWHIDGNTYYFNFITKMAKEPAKHPGDITKGGFTIVIPKGMQTQHPIEVGGFLYRMVCSNGMISRSAKMVQLQGQNYDQLMTEMEAYADRALANVEKNVLPDFVNSTGQPVVDAHAFVHHTAVEYKLPPQIRAAILDRLPSLGDHPTQYDLVNLITSHANTLEWRLARRVQSYAGRVIDRELHRCTNCHRTLQGGQ